MRVCIVRTQSEIRVCGLGTYVCFDVSRSMHLTPNPNKQSRITRVLINVVPACMMYVPKNCVGLRALMCIRVLLMGIRRCIHTCIAYP